MNKWYAVFESALYQFTTKDNLKKIFTANLNNCDFDHWVKCNNIISDINNRYIGTDKFFDSVNRVYIYDDNNECTNIQLLSGNTDYRQIIGKLERGEL